MKMLAARLVLVAGALTATVGAQAQSSVAEFRCSTSGSNCVGQIPDAPITTGLTSTIAVPATQCIGGLRSANVRLDITHEAVGDLRVRLTAPGGAQAIVLDDVADGTGVAGSCQGDDVNALFVTAGALPSCGVSIPAVGATVRSLQSLTALGTATATAGTWTLEVFDDANDNTGSLNDWAIQSVCTVSIPLPGPGAPWLLAGLFAVVAIGGGALVRRR